MAAQQARTDLPVRALVPTLRAARAGKSLREYEILFGARSRRRGRGIRADRIMREGWSHAGLEINLVPPIDWENATAGNRSAAYRLQSWTPLNPVLVRHSDTGAPQYLDFALSVALDWSSRYPSVSVESQFAWYDVAIGLRAQRIGYLLDAALREEHVSDDQAATLLETALLHAHVLSDDERVAWHTNHGFYLAAGQLALANRLADVPGIAAGRSQALSRLDALIASQFTDEGVHREHSPGYHAAVWRSIAGLLDAGLVEASELPVAREAIEEALAWFVTPDGRLATIGDTNSERIAGGDVDPQAHHALQFALSEGRAGRAPERRVRAFERSGYVVFRTWPEQPEGFASASHVAQIAAFHSRTHKHADDLSFVWHDRGTEILVDPGRYGYIGRTDPGSSLAREGFWYSHPGRIYVESTRAHNTVEIDDRSHRRVGIEPYGSAVRAWGEADGVCVAMTRVVHLESIEHLRILLLRPTEWLVVLDRVRDSAEAPHSLTQRFHFAPELELATAGEGYRADGEPFRDEPLWISPIVPAPSLPPARGVTTPQLLGWVSRAEAELTQSSTAGFRVEGAPGHDFGTLLAFGADGPTARSARLGDNLADAELAWTQAGARHELVLASRPDHSISVQHRVS